MRVIHETSATFTEPCVATIGFFDGVHKGHRYLIQQVKETAAAKGMRSALITFPVHPRKVMHADYSPELLTTFDEKIELLSQTEVDYCLTIDFTPEFSRLSAAEFMERILKKRFHVEYLIIGYDHRFGHNRSEGFDDYARYGRTLGIEVMQAKAFTESLPESAAGGKPISSSLIRRLLQQSKVSEANHCLGYSYFLDGTITGGHQIGRQIGFPTANLRVDDPDKLIPADGVYAVWATVNEKRYMGMLNIGQRPTLDNGTERTIETHILHFHENIYGQSLRLTFVRWIRPEKKFDSLQALTEELRKDAEEAESILRDETVRNHTT